MSDRENLRSLPTPYLARDGWPLGWPAIGVLLALFAGLAILAGTVATLPGDLWVTHHVQRLQGQPWQTLARAGNAFGGSPWVIGGALLTLPVAAVLRWWDDVVLIIVILVLRLAAVPIKGIVQSPRPTADQAHIVEPISGYGFPSGHTLTATLLFGGLAVLLVRHWPPGLRRWPTMWIDGLAAGGWAIAVICTGFGRVWFGAHWTSDVLGAALLGIACVGIAAAVRLSDVGEDAGNRTIARPRRGRAVNDSSRTRTDLGSPLSARLRRARPDRDGLAVLQRQRR
jgi:undecaprenyl-diphosphatase